MHAEASSSSSRPSTTWSWRKVKISTPPEADKRVARRASTTHHLSRRELRSKVTVEVHFRGGAECWWELRARGVTMRRPGHLSLHDVLKELYGQ